MKIPHSRNAICKSYLLKHNSSFLTVVNSWLVDFKVRVRQSDSISMGATATILTWDWPWSEHWMGARNNQVWPTLREGVLALTNSCHILGQVVKIVDTLRLKFNRRIWQVHNVNLPLKIEITCVIQDGGKRTLTSCSLSGSLTCVDPLLRGQILS